MLALGSSTSVFIQHVPGHWRAGKVTRSSHSVQNLHSESFIIPFETSSTGDLCSVSGALVVFGVGKGIQELIDWSETFSVPRGYVCRAAAFQAGQLNRRLPSGGSLQRRGVKQHGLNERPKCQ